jgi:hypothetical protein
MMDDLQLTEDEFETLFIQPVTAILPEALRICEFNLVKDREIDNAQIRKFHKGQEATMKRENLTWTEGELSNGSKVYYPTYNGDVKKANI